MHIDAIRVHCHFEAHSRVVDHWASAWWQGWQPPALMEKAIKQAQAKLACGGGELNWGRVTGPAAALVATGSPGPAILAIAGTSMTSGRSAGLAVASGVTTGSWMWSAMAAFGLGAIMLSHVWLFETIRIAGAGYLLFLPFKSARAMRIVSNSQT